MSPPPPESRIHALRQRILVAYRKLVLDSGFPGAARNPFLFTGFLVREIVVKELSTRAMALSYQFLFCLVPALTLTLALLALLPGLAPAREMVTDLVVREFLAADTELVSDQVATFVANAEVFSLVGTAVLVYGAGVLISTLYGAINAIWNIRPAHVAWWQRLGPLGLIGSLLAGAVFVAVATSGPFQSVLTFLDRSPLFSSGIRSFITSFLVGWALTFMLYKLVPSTWVHTGSAAIAAGVTSLLFSSAKVAFLAYASSSDTYARIYGVLGTLFLGLLWNWLAWFLILAGAALAFVAQNYEHLAGREQHRLLGDRHHTWHGVRLMLALYRASARGETPIAVAALSRELGRAAYLIDQLGDALAEGGLLRQSGSSHWEHLSPAIPATEVTVADVAAALSREALEMPEAGEDEAPGDRALRQLLGNARSSVASTLREATLDALLRCDAGSAEPDARR